MSSRDNRIDIYPWRLAGQKSEWCFSDQPSVTGGCIECGATPCTKYHGIRCVKHYQRKLLTNIPDKPSCRKYFCRCVICQTAAPEEEASAQQEGAPGPAVFQTTRAALQDDVPPPPASQAHNVGTASPNRGTFGRARNELTRLRQQIANIRTQVVETESVLDNLIQEVDRYVDR